MSFIENATSLTTEVGRILSECEDIRHVSKVMEKLQEAKSLVKEALDVYSSSTRNRVHYKVKKHIVSISNTLDGLINGIEDKEISRLQFKAVCENVRTNFIPALLESIDALKNKARPVDLPQNIDLKDIDAGLRATITESNAWSDGIEFLKEVVNASTDANKAKEINQKISKAIREELKNEEAKELLKQLRMKASAFPTKLKGEYSFIRATVIPIVDNPFSLESSFAKAGINFVNVLGYLIVRDQVLVGISKRALDASSAEVSKTHRIKNKPTPVNYVKTVLALVNERMPQQFTLVSESPVANPRNADILYYWVMPFRKFSYIAMRGSSKIKQWAIFV